MTPLPSMAGAGLAEAVTETNGRWSVTMAFHCLPDIDMGLRAAAAQAAGFSRIGLSARRLRPLLAAGGFEALRATLDARGLSVGEVEVLRPLEAAPDPDEDLIFGVAAATGAGHVTCIAPLPEAGPGGDLPDAGVRDAGVREAGIDADTMAAFSARLAAACDRAAERGLHLDLEFLPWTAVPDVATAAAVVSAAARSNLGICLDVWHLYRGGDAPAAVASYWPLVSTLQLSDGPLVAQDADLLQDCLTNRRPVGSGEFDIAGLLAAARANAGALRISVEVISAALRSLPPEQNARAVAAGLEAALSGE